MLSKKQTIGGLLSIIVLAAMYFIPHPANLSVAGVRTIGIIIAFLIMLIMEVLPLSVTCLLFLGLMSLLGAAQNFSASLTGFSNQVVFFIVPSFAIAAGFTQIPLSKRILKYILSRFGKNVKSILLSMMACSALLSSIVSNVPTCAIFMSIALAFLKLYEDEDERNKTGKAFMIAIPVSSMIGGMMTPAGTSINLLAISLLEEYADTTITFVQWTAMGVPIVLILIPIAWLLIYKIYKPVEIEISLVKSFIEKLDVPKQIGKKEKKVILITCIMMVLWIASSWIRGINVMVVALLGACMLFMPGINVLKWENFIKEMNWDSFFLVGTVLSIGNAMVANGVAEWIGTMLPTTHMALPIFVAFVAVVVFLILILIPIGPTVVTLMAAPLIAMAVGMGYNPAIIVFTLSVAAANCYLLPLDTVALITYSSGYYKMLDMTKSTLFIQICLTALLSILAPLIGSLTGLI